jgi:hypothetical protein
VSGKSGLLTPAHQTEPEEPFVLEKNRIYLHKSPVEFEVIMVSRLYYRLWWWSQILGHDFEKWS